MGIVWSKIMGNSIINDIKASIESLGIDIEKEVEDFYEFVKERKEIDYAFY